MPGGAAFPGPADPPTLVGRATGSVSVSEGVGAADVAAALGVAAAVGAAVVAAPVADRETTLGEGEALADAVTGGLGVAAASRHASARLPRLSTIVQACCWVSATMPQRPARGRTPAGR